MKSVSDEASHDGVQMDEPEVLDEQQLKQWLGLTVAVEERPYLIAVEGHPLSGKTTLARSLADASDWIRVSTDSYVIVGKPAQTYLDRLDWKRLLSDIQKLQDRFSAVVIEGVCLRDVLERLGLNADVFIYCKRITQAQRWADDPTYEETAEASPGTAGWLDHEVHDYHLRQRPHLKANAIYQWAEEAP